MAPASLRAGHVAQLRRGPEDVEYEHSCGMILCNTDKNLWKQISCLNGLRSLASPWVLIIPAMQSGISTTPGRHPVVFRDRVQRGSRVDFVGVAIHVGAYKAMKHPIHMGHGQIVINTGSPDLPKVLERLEGSRVALQGASISVDPEYGQEGKICGACGHKYSIRIVRQLPRPSALFSTNDLMTYGICPPCGNSVSRASTTFPRSFPDKMEPSDLPLTAVYLPGYHLDRRAACLLLSESQVRLEGS